VKAFAHTHSIRADGTKDSFAGWEVPHKLVPSKVEVGYRVYVLVHGRWRRVWGKPGAWFIKAPPFHPMTIHFEE
jgi:hypothetical protein